MGIFRPFLGGVKSLEEFRKVDHSHDKPFTPADTLTIARPALAVKAAGMLLRGEKGAFPVVAAMGASDMEGKLARLIDKVWPDSGWGSTEHGAPWDTYADTSALLIVCSAALRAPRVTRGGKAAMVTVLGQEGVKTGWALTRNQQYQRVSGERLALPSSVAGKEAMAEKLTAVGLAVATNDTDNALLRTTLSAGALYFAVVGSWRGEQARYEYEPLIDEMKERACSDISQPVAPVMPGPPRPIPG